MFYKSERQILNFLKYAPIAFIISMGLIITLLLFFQSTQELNDDKKEITQKFIQDNKKLVQDQVEQAHTYITSQKAATEKQLQQTLYDAVQFAHTVAQSIYNENRGKSKAYIEEEIKTALRNVRFNEGRGYFFIYDKKGVNIMHPLLPRVEGQNLRFFNNKEGQAPVDESLKLLKDHADSFQTWYWQKRKEDTKLYKKLGYVKNFYEMGWFIGTGEYIDDFEEQIKKKTITYLRNIKFGNNGYVFVVDYEGNILTSTTQQTIQDALQTESLSKLMTEAKIKAKGGGGFVEYPHSSKELQREDSIKTSYVKDFAAWNWVIGSGFYKDDLNVAILDKKRKIDNSFVDHTINTVMIIAALVIILLLISVYISKLIEKKFTRYQKDIQEQITHNIDQKNHLLQAQKAAKIGNWEVDTKTMKATWSDEIYNIMGLSKRSHAGPEALRELMIKEDWQSFKDSLVCCINEDIDHHAIYRIKRQNDQELRWIDCRGHKLHNQDKIIGTFQDITDQKKIEQRLFEQKERLDIFFNASPQAIVISDLDRNIIECNQTFISMLGYEKEQVLTMNISDLSYSEEEDGYSISLLEQLKNQQRDTFNLKKRFHKKDGGYLWGNVTVAPIFDHHKKIQCFLAMIEDITLVKQTEDDLLQKEQMLHHQSKMAAMGEMLENIAHQWRQPLSVITTSASAVKLNHEFDQLKEDELIMSMDAIMDSSKHLSSTIDEFRDFFKPNKEKSTFNIKTPYEKTVSLLSSKFKNRSISLIEEIEEFTVIGYENSLIQVLMNIYNNAKDALEAINDDDKYILTTIKKDKDWVKITIKDSAGGIPEDIISKIFEPYFTTKHQSQGTGIGLYMSEEIISKHMHGRLRVRNCDFIYNGKSLRGAEFTLSFPLEVD